MRIIAYPFQKFEVIYVEEVHCACVICETTPILLTSIWLAEPKFLTWHHYSGAMPWCNKDGKEGITWLKAKCCRVWYISNFAMSTPRLQVRWVALLHAILCYGLWYAKCASLLVSSAKQLQREVPVCPEEKSKFIASRSLKWIVPMWSLCMVACMKQWIFVCCPTEDCRGVFSIRRRKIISEDGTFCLEILYDSLYYLGWALTFTYEMKSAHAQHNPPCFGPRCTPEKKSSFLSPVSADSACFRRCLGHREASGTMEWNAIGEQF
jgi:hypothetical protein